MWSAYAPCSLATTDGKKILAEEIRPPTISPLHAEPVEAPRNASTGSARTDLPDPLFLLARRHTQIAPCAQPPMTDKNPDPTHIRLAKRVAEELNCSRSTAEQFIEGG